MPYIPRERRMDLESRREIVNHPGELNYRLTREVLAYLGDTPNYERFDAAVGALECAKMELYRRMVVPYENEKVIENGDVYPERDKRSQNAARDVAKKLHDSFVKNGQYPAAR